MATVGVKGLDTCKYIILCPLWRCIVWFRSEQESFCHKSVILHCSTQPVLLHESQLSQVLVYNSNHTQYDNYALWWRKLWKQTGMIQWLQ